MHNSLQRCALFADIGGGDIDAMLHCLNAREMAYPRDSTVFLAGNPAGRVGVVLEGVVQVVRDDLLGNRAILANIDPGDLFGETFACAGVDMLPVSVTALCDCRVVLLDYRKIIHTCTSACVFHGQLVENMLRILAQKNLMLNAKIEVLSARTTRDKLLGYLASCAARAGRRRFAIPYNRQELADYLAVDRSALSREMAAMQREGMIRYNKNRFELLGEDVAGPIG